MATAYTTYTATSSIPYTYHFTCEHCGMHSGFISSAVQGSDQININGKGQPTFEQQLNLNAGAQANARMALKSKITKAEQGKYGEDVSSKCPHCGKIQSWELKSGSWKPLFYALQGLACGFLIMIFVGFFSKKAGNAMVICMPIGIAIGLIIGLVERMRAKSDSSKTTVRNKPEFIWPVDEASFASIDTDATK